MNVTGSRSPFGSFSISLDKLNGDDGADFVLEKKNFEVKIDIVFDSPVIALPRSRTSSEVLVANLGQITLSANGTSPWDDGLKSVPPFREEKVEFSEGVSHSDAITYSLFIRDVCLYSLDLKERWNMIDNMKMYESISGFIFTFTIYVCN
jgi:hypothetical protein